MLSLAGAKGQPGTIIEPSGATSGGEALATPGGLTASAGADAINLKWSGVADGASSVKVYRSEKPGTGFKELTSVDASVLNAVDQTAFKGTTYYYVVTAVTAAGAESGNSAQVSAVIDVPPLIPQGIYSWADVKKKAEADADYLRILTKVTDLTMSDIDRLVDKEKSGVALKTTLLAGTMITNTMEDYRIVPNFVLPNDREALTDENGVPHIMVKCGNPIKRQVPVTNTTVVIQDIQVVVTTVINILPPNVTNIFVNAGQSANTILIDILPEGIRVILGPGIAPPPPDVYVDPADFGDDLYDPETDIELEEGQQWINEGKLLITATPPDPAPQESVTMTVKLFPAEAGVTVDYSMTGTDGYTTSGSNTTDANGEMSFTIPGGAAEVHDSITVNVPSKNLGGTVEYTF